MMDESLDNKISGRDAFKLYDTYGFPFELTEEYLADLGYKVSKEEFDKYMNIQKEMAKKNMKNKTKMASQKKVLLDFKDPSEFVYGIYRLKSTIIAIFAKDEQIEKSNHDTYIATQRTCFYAESGGQVSDTGMIIGKNFKARVVDVFKGPNGQHIHKVRLLDGEITVKDEVELIIDKDRRKEIEANHSSAHILQHALRETVSKSIAQAGSYVDNEKVRFDFTYTGKMTDQKILEVEAFANQMIQDELIVSTETMPIDKAKELGAIALFSEKYGDVVRVVKIGKSIELCGGTHVTNTKEISSLAIYLCESKGSNLYRIEAATKNRIDSTMLEAIKPYNDEKIKLLMKAKDILESARSEGMKLEFDVDINNDIPTSYKDIIYHRNELQYVQEEVKELEKKYHELKEKETLQNLDHYIENIKEINGIQALIMKTNVKDISLLKAICDQVMKDMKNGFLFFANIKEDESVNYIAKSTSNIHAGYIVKEASQRSEGNGGGSPTFAQGGGKKIDDLDQILKQVELEIKNHE